MRRAKHGLKALVLGAIVGLGALALAGGAQGAFLVNLGSVLLATIAARQIGTSSFLIAGRSLEIRCTGLELNGAKINTSTDASGEAVLTGCKTFDHKTSKEFPCQFKELETIKMQFLILPILHGGENFLLFEPIPPSNVFAFVSFKEGMGCPLPLNNPVSGTFSALVDALDAVVQLILFSEAIQLLTGDKLAFGGFLSYIHAHREIELTGTHAGQKLGIH